MSTDGARPHAAQNMVDAIAEAVRIRRSIIALDLPVFAWLGAACARDFQ